MYDDDVWFGVGLFGAGVYYFGRSVAALAEAWPTPRAVHDARQSVR